MMSGMMLVMLLVGGGNAGDLLDYTPTEAYWEMRDQRIIDVDTMSAVMADDDATHADKLMAIRALGELSKAEDATAATKAKALIVLTPLVESKEPFVGRYAKRSLAWLKGEEPDSYPALPDEVYDLDLALMPADATIVGQLKMANGVGPIDLAAMIPDVEVEGRKMRDQMMQQMVPGILQAVEMIGNARADLVTAGFVLNGQEEVSFMVAIRGKYDRVGVQMALEEEMGDDEDASFYSVGDIEVVDVKSYDPVAMLMPSNELFILLFADDRNAKLPIDAVAKKLQQADRKPAFDALLTKQVAAIDREKADVWAAMKVPQIMKDEPEVRDFFGAFDAGRAFATRDTEGMLDIQWVGEGTNEDAVKRASEYMAGMVNETVEEMKAEKPRMPEAMQQFMDPMIKMMASMKFTPEGKTMTGGMKVDPNIGMTMPMMFMNVRVDRVQRENAVRAAEAAGAAEEAAAE